jgi:hypothetical protein
MAAGVGELADGLGGGGVLAQDVAVVARDLRADLEVRGCGRATGSSVARPFSISPSRVPRLSPVAMTNRDASRAANKPERQTSHPREKPPNFWRAMIERSGPITLSKHATARGDRWSKYAPPLTSIILRVTYLAASFARNIAAWATSCTVATAHDTVRSTS